MKILVEHEISNHEESCLYYSSDSFMDGRSLCKYHKFRVQTHGRKRPSERKPKCVLFDTWLEKPYQKCIECKDYITY